MQYFFPDDMHSAKVVFIMVTLHYREWLTMDRVFISKTCVKQYRGPV